MGEDRLAHDYVVNPRSPLIHIKVSAPMVFYCQTQKVFRLDLIITGIAR